MKKDKKYLKSFFILFLFMFISLNIFAVNNEEAINANIRYKQYLDLNNYGGQDFANKHIKNSSATEQQALLKDRNEIKKRINAVTDLLKEAKEMDMSYKWGGNHSANGNVIESFQQGFDCSGWTSYYIGLLGIKYDPHKNGAFFSGNRAVDWHNTLRNLVETARRSGYTMRMDNQYHSENGWIYTFAYKNSTSIKHISISVGNEMCHARGGEKIEKTIDITGRPQRNEAIALSFNMEDILYFIASEPTKARQLGFSLTNMPSPDQVRGDWSKVRKGTRGGRIAEGAEIAVSDQDGDDGLSIAYEMFHIELNLDEVIGYPIFEKLSGVLDAIMPVAIAIAVILILINVLYDILKLVLLNSKSLTFKNLFFSSFEKVMSALIILTLLGFYKDIIYKPLIDFVTNGFVKEAFGTQIYDTLSSADVPEGNLNALYYLAVKPLKTFSSEWINTFMELNSRTSWEIIKSFPDYLELLLKAVLMCFCCIITIYLALKFVISVLMVQIGIIFTLAFSVFTLAVSVLPMGGTFLMTPINAVINSVMKLMPIYLMMLVWLQISEALVNYNIPNEVVIYYYFLLFMFMGLVFQVFRYLVKYMFEVVNAVASAIQNN